MISVVPTVKIGLVGSGFSGGFQANAFGGLTLVDVSMDLLGNLTVEYGIRSNDPTDRVAAASEAAFTLDNSEQNSAQAIALYSMFNSERLLGFDFNIGVEVSLSCAEVSGGIPFYKFFGKLADAASTSGVYLDRVTECRALDIFDEYAQIDEPEIDVQLDQRADQIIAALLDPLDTQPVARDIDTGSERYSIALDGGTGQKLKVRERLQQICLSEFGYAYPIGGTVTAGTFRFENRQHRASNPDVLFTVEKIDNGGLPVPGSRDDLYSLVEVAGYPTNDLSSAVDVVLYSLQTTQILVQPGEINDSIFGPYRDPINNDPIGGDTSSMTDPSPTTDFTMNSAPDGSGADLTGSFTVTTSRTGQGVRFVITNVGGSPGYVTKLQQQGKPIYRYEALVTRTITTAYGARPLSLVMPFQNNLNVCKDAADYLKNVHATRVGRPPSVRFLANQDVDYMTAALTLEPGDRIAVSEDVNGLDSAEFTINGCRLECQPGGFLWCTWFLEPASAQQAWLIGVPGASEIGVSTVPGF